MWAGWFCGGRGGEWGLKMSVWTWTRVQDGNNLFSFNMIQACASVSPCVYISSLLKDLLPRGIRMSPSPPQGSGSQLLFSDAWVNAELSRKACARFQDQWWGPEEDSRVFPGVLSNIRLGWWYSARRVVVGFQETTHEASMTPGPAHLLFAGLWLKSLIIMLHWLLVGRKQVIIFKNYINYLLDFLKNFLWLYLPLFLLV